MEWDDDQEMSEKSVSSIIKDNLCTGCGTCVSLCPHDAIELWIDSKKGTYVPNIDLEACNNCGICRQACPGGEVDFDALNIKLFGKKPDDNLLGNYINCYAGYSTNEGIRYNSSSGGLVTALLIFALEEGIIDGALVTRMKKDKPLEPEPFVARTREEIIEASKSKYCPVPANVALKKIMESSDGERFAVVGLPCHIHGIRKAQNLDKRLKEKVILTLGLMCGHTPNFKATEAFLDMHWNIKKEDVKKLDYRGSGWPGLLKCKLNGKDLSIDQNKCWKFIGSSFFSPDRCLICADFTAELADISFGDAWLPELRNDKKGCSIVISRTASSEMILKQMIDRGKIVFRNSSRMEVIKSQFVPIYNKKFNIKSYYQIFDLFQKALPSYNIDMHHRQGFGIDSLFHFLNASVSRNAIGIRILHHIPFKIIFIYGSFLNGFPYLWLRLWWRNHKGQEPKNLILLAANENPTIRQY